MTYQYRKSYIAYLTAVGGIQKEIHPKLKYLLFYCGHMLIALFPKTMYQTYIAYR